MSEHRKEKKQAAALKYDAEQNRAPYIVGLGQGYVAENMLKAAAEHGIPVVEDTSLSNALQKLGIGEDIPEDLYQVVAEVLVFVTKLDNGRGSRFGLNETVIKRYKGV
ncbi:MAG: EscU/YscU/HrcU family type III secretion system export apparatus switch protein [Clostridiales bacterium]|jgi:flagellar biosynthesis protein|nr:EscU/YscU/HrcU family type III secretion system export apparatus switch protein [Clostridiales bacterium]